MRQTPEQSSKLYDFADWILRDDQRRQWYDEAKMHWIGDPDPEVRESGRHPWVKRQRDDGNEYVFAEPVLAAFSIAKESLISIHRDRWHSPQNPKAWFVGIHNLRSGQATEPRLSQASVSKYGQMRLRLDHSPHRHARDQTRIEAWLHDGHTREARYYNGLRESPVDYEDIVSLEAMMRVINQSRGMLLPEQLAPTSVGTSYYGRAA